MPIWKTADEKNGVMNAVSSLKEVLHKAEIRVKIDDTEQRTPGWKFNFWEMKVWITTVSGIVYMVLSISNILKI